MSLHNSYFLLRQALREVEPWLVGAVVDHVAQRQWQDLRLILLTPDEVKSVQIAFFENDAYLGFPKPETGTTWQPIFNELTSRTIERVVMHRYERAFHLEFAGGFRLLVRLHGRAGNVHLLGPEEFHETLRWQRHDDKLADLSFLPDFDSTEALALLAENGEIKKEIEPLLKSPMIKQWRAFQDPFEPQALAALLGNLNDQVVLTAQGLSLRGLVIGPNDIIHSYPSVSEALTDYTSDRLFRRLFQERQQEILATLRNALQVADRKRLQAERLIVERQKAGYQEIGDTLMANMALVPERKGRVELPSVYTGLMLSIKLDQDLSPQDNAASYYKKMKQEGADIASLQKNLQAAEAEIVQLRAWLDDTEKAKRLKQLPQLPPKYGSSKEGDPAALPFRRFEIQGFEVLVGKGAKENEVLLSKHSRPFDLWLHARDVTGSHVLIKRTNKDKTVPKPVIEIAAGLALFYSKAKGETLAAVSVTERKYVLKMRRGAPGQVRLLREEVVMVPVVVPADLPQV